MEDLDKREFFYFVPLVLLVIWLGVAPGYILDRTGPSVEKLINQYQSKLAAPVTAVTENTIPEAKTNE